VARFEDEANPFAAPDADLSDQNQRLSARGYEYGGFLARFAAAFLDGLIIQIVGRAIMYVISMSMENGFQVIMIALLLNTVINWLYSALQESSEACATIGKRALGLKVLDLEGQRISFARATGRHFAKIPSLLILGIGYFMQPFTERRQALHDIMAGTIVVKG
jgi:uncharacterized RDD family membrane protein YckC